MLIVVVRNPVKCSRNRSDVKFDQSYLLGPPSGGAFHTFLNILSTGVD